MSTLANGTYYIVNRQTTADGTPLAVTFNGRDETLTVIEKGSQPSQKWIISDGVGNGVVQTISPQEATGFQAKAAANNTIIGGPNVGYAWAIRGSGGVYTICDNSFSIYWGINEAQVGQKVVYGVLTSNTRQNWEFVPA